jgi:hypothetical protein
VGNSGDDTAVTVVRCHPVVVAAREFTGEHVGVAQQKAVRSFFDQLVGVMTEGEPAPDA